MGKKSFGTPQNDQQREIVQLRNIVKNYEEAQKQPLTGNENPRTLMQKLKYMQEVLKNLEKERSELSVRATMAEEQLRNLQEHMNNSTQNYQKQIAELKRQLPNRKY